MNNDEMEAEARLLAHQAALAFVTEHMRQVYVGRQEFFDYYKRVFDQVYCKLACPIPPLPIPPEPSVQIKE